MMKRNGRILYFEGIPNCRDLGGLETADGRQIREGLLLRTAHLNQATPNDIHELQTTFRLSEILDLRNPMEQAENPDVPVPGAAHIDLPIIEAEQWGITHEENLPAYEVYPPMEELYFQFITREPFNRNIAGAVHRVLVHDYDRGAILWHCFGGKDRCGLVAALTLSVLGVPYPEIKKDYMLTNLSALAAAEIVRASVLERGGSQKEADFTYDAYIAKESFLDSAFDAVQMNHGDAVSFLKEMGGISEEEIGRFKQRLLV